MATKVVNCPKCGTSYDATKVHQVTRVRCRKCGTIFTINGTDSTENLIGKILGGYEILEKLGEGGIGAVYKARQLSLSRLVAIKTLKPEFANNASFVARLQREARSAAQISHPNIVQTIDVGFDKGIHFIAMELIEGQTLTEIIANKGRLSVTEALDFLEQAARALEKAHELGIIHRDIKPDNIIVTKNGTIKLMDFGLAKRPELDVSVTQEGAIAGTPRYMSPEQGSGKPLDHRSDIYSLGATIYHALAGAPPFDGPTAVAVILKHVSEPLPPIRSCNHLVTPKLAAIIERMLAKQPEDRFQSARELLDAIADARSTLTEDMAAVQSLAPTTPTIAAAPPSAGVSAEKVLTPSQAPVSPITRQRSRRLVISLLMVGGLLATIIGVVAIIMNKQARLERTFRALEEQARALTYEDRYQEAMDVFDQFPLQNASRSWQRCIAEAKRAIAEEAEGRFRRLCAEADAELQEKRYLEVRQRYLEVAEKYGIPKIKEEALKRAESISHLMETEAAKMLEAIKDATSKGGRPDVSAIAKYNELTRLYPGTVAAREADEYFENLRKKIRARAWRNVITVAKDGTANYTSIREAVNHALNGSSIEIQDAAVYEEQEIVTSRSGIILKGVKERPPTILAAKRPKPPEPLEMAHRLGRLMLPDDPRIPALFNVQSGWRFENLILNGGSHSKGIVVTGSVTVINCAFVNLEGSAILSPGKGFFAPPEAAKIKHLDVANSSFLNIARGAVVTIDQSGNLEAHLDFNNNLVCGAQQVFWRVGIPVPDSSFTVRKCIFEHVKLLLHDPNPERVKMWKFEKNCYGRRGPVAYLMDPDSSPISDLKSWQEAIGNDQDSFLADPMFADSASGNFTLNPQSICAKEGLGPRIATVLQVNLSLIPEPPPQKEKPTPPSSAPVEDKPQVAAPPKEASLDTALLKARESVRALVTKNHFSEALAACQAIKGDDVWKSEHSTRIIRLVELKRLMVEHINAQGNIPVPSSLWQRKKELTGGIFKSATDEQLCVDVKGKTISLTWEDLSPDDMRLLAEKCTDIQSASEQIALACLCIEQGISEKARPYLNYAKATAKSQSEKHEIAQLEKLIPPVSPSSVKPVKSEAASPPSTGPAPKSLTKVLNKLKDLADERRLDEAVLLFQETRNEYTEEPEFYINFGLIIGKAVTNNYTLKTPLPKQYPPVQLAKFALKYGLKLAPNHPSAREAQHCLEVLQELTGEEKNR